MTTLKDRVYAILDTVGNRTADAVRKIRSSDSELIGYVLMVGVDHLKAKRRQRKRQELKATVLKPEFVRGAVSGSIKLSRRYVGKLKKVADTLFQDWTVGGVSLGDWTKEFLVEQARQGRLSAKGALFNSVFYEKLAQPMKPGQTVSEHWKSPEAVLLIRAELLEDTAEKDVDFT
jgi:hypothetical protein